MEFSKDKREEYKTYRELKLGRNLKSRARRAMVERKRVNRVIGGGDLPYLEVNNMRYLALRMEITRRLLREAKDAGIHVPIESLMASLRHRIDRLTYQQFALEQQAAAQVETAFVQHHGRQPTKQEKQCFIDSALVGQESQPVYPPAFRSGVIDEVLSHVRNRQENNPARYQTAWAQVVGPDIAQQSQLDKVDAASGTAYFRCYNSVLSYQLQRSPGLPQKLGKALGITIRQLKVRH